VWQPLPGDGDKPLARYGSCGSVGPDGALWVSHGFTHDSGRFNDTHSYDLARGRWFDKTPPAPLPVDRCLHDCFWTAAGSLLLYAGQTTGVKALADLWSYDPLAAAWTEQPKPPAPARQLYALATYGNQAVVFGGGDIDGGYLNDVWRIDVDTLSWIEIGRTGDAPAARSAATLIADTLAGRLLLFGGKNADGEFGDLWELTGGE
jgi:Kelch motif